MIDIRDITPGRAYACKFRVQNTALDEHGSYGLREGFGFLKQRDTEQQLVIVVDQATQQEFVCAYDDIWAVDEVELVDD